MKKLLNTSFVYLILALAAGVFYREFTKFNGFTGNTTLGLVHTHLLVLGTLFFLIAALFASHKPALLEDSLFTKFYLLYNIALPLMACMLLVRGVLTVNEAPVSSAVNGAVSGIAGLSHILIAIALVLFFVVLKRHLAASEK